MTRNQQQGDRLELTINSEADITMAFRWIPPCPEGFLMGDRRETDSQPVHRVIISRSFWLGETLVTQAQFAAWTETEKYQIWLKENQEKLYNGDKPHKNDFDDGDPKIMPADSVSFYEARAFCEWLNALAIPGDEGRATLPTEAQWEYACRAGEMTDYYSGDGIAALEQAGWYDGNSDRKTHPVAQKDHNSFGLFDMHGNLWEWCLDAWEEGAYRGRGKSAPDPVAASREAEGKSSFRVLRGGSWFSSASRCRSAYRFGDSAGGRPRSFGFRVGLFPGPGGPSNNIRR